MSNNFNEALDELERQEEIETSEINSTSQEIEANSLPQKRGMFSRIKDYFATKNQEYKDAKEAKVKTIKEKPVKEKPVKKSNTSSSIRTLLETNEDDVRKFNEFLGALEVHLDKVEDQNEHLVKQLSTLEKNNNLLLEQVQTLTKNNNQLTEQYNNMKKREKIAKIMAIIAATFSIGLAIFTIFNLIFNIL